VSRDGGSAGAPGSAAILPFGDDAVLLDLREPAGIRSARRAQALARAVASLRAGDARIGPPVPGVASVLVPFDPIGADSATVIGLLEPLLAGLSDDPAPPPGAREHVIPVRYGGAGGPDLAGIAAVTGLGEDDVVTLHAGTTYEVLFLGFAPGFAYLGGLPAVLALPRLSTPRTRVPAGSVAIADRLTAVYPGASPGGWRLLGHADVTLFDPAADPPVRLRAGDRVKFAPR
jgi:KipI family sensor histidine kinase inhibitor